LLSNEPPRTQFLIPCTRVFDFSSPHRSRQTPSTCISRTSPGINTTWANMIHFSVGVASNPKFLWTTVLSSSAQRDALVVFRFGVTTATG
jgi:hypothetical protein